MLLSATRLGGTRNARETEQITRRRGPDAAAPVTPELAEVAELKGEVEPGICWPSSASLISVRTTVPIRVDGSASPAPPRT